MKVMVCRASEACWAGLEATTRTAKPAEGRGARAGEACHGVRIRVADNVAFAQARAGQQPWAPRPAVCEAALAGRQLTRPTWPQTHCQAQSTWLGWQARSGGVQSSHTQQPGSQHSSPSSPTCTARRTDCAKAMMASSSRPSAMPSLTCGDRRVLEKGSMLA